MEPPEKKQRSDKEPDPWVHPCEECITFRLVRSATSEELEAEIAKGGIEFDGEFFHQHFGEEEAIKGYKNLAVNVWMSAQTYHTWLDIKFTQKKLGADKIEKVFREHFPSGFVKSKAEFIEEVTKGAGAMSCMLEAGEPMCTLDVPGPNPKVHIRRYNLATSPKALQDMHARFEPLLLFFIDGASLIEKGDDKWVALVAVQPTPSGNLTLGLTTLYNFWAYPAASRLRLSQILVLAPFREAGLGKAMLAAAYRMAREQGCVDLTIEDPTPNLQRVREKLEVESLLATPWVVEQAAACAQAAIKGNTGWPVLASAAAAAATATGDAVTAPSASAPAVAGEAAAVAGAAVAGSAVAGSAVAGAAGAAVADPMVVDGDDRENVDSNIEEPKEGGAAAGSSKPAADHKADSSAGRSAGAVSLPGAVVSEAEAAAGRQQRAAAAATGGSFAADTAAAGTGAAAGWVSGGGAGPSSSSSSNPCAPPLCFLERVRSELKIYTKEARMAWEAVLYLQPGLWDSAAGRAALEALVRGRLEAGHFAHCGPDAERKRLVQLKGPEAEDFIMMRAKPVAVEAVEGGVVAAAAAAADGAGTSNGAVAQGRLTITTITTEEKAAKLGELMEERQEQLATLGRLLRAGADKAGEKRKVAA